jgi:hypothetical protein
MTSQEIFEEMQQLWTIVEVNNKRFQDKGVKAAGSIARKAINEIKKLAGKYRSTCLSESKVQ